MCCLLWRNVYRNLHQPIGYIGASLWLAVRAVLKIKRTDRKGPNYTVRLRYELRLNLCGSLLEPCPIWESASPSVPPRQTSCPASSLWFDTIVFLSGKKLV